MSGKLTAAEQFVLAELAKGTDNQRELAARLNISRSSVAMHLHSMYQKTGTQNQVQLLRWAFRQAQAVLGDE